MAVRTQRDISIQLSSSLIDVLVYEGYVDKEAGQLLFDCLAEGLIQADVPTYTLLDIEALLNARRDEQADIMAYDSSTDFLVPLFDNEEE